LIGKKGRSPDREQERSTRQPNQVSSSTFHVEGERLWGTLLESSMNEKIGAAHDRAPDPAQMGATGMGPARMSAAEMGDNLDRNLGRAATASRPFLRSGTFALAVVLGALVGVSAARVLTSQSPTPHLWQTSVAAQPSSAPASFADVVDAVKPAVIGVQTRLAVNLDDSGPQSPRDRFSRRFGAPQLPGSPGQRPDRIITAQGSGFFISADGYAVTNNHVVEDNGIIQVQTDDQKTYPAKVVGTDPMTDLALLKVDGRNDFAHVKLADAMPRVGDWVLAIGNPFGLGGTVTAGIVSARERDIGADSYDRLIQIDAPINKGDSGGPSFDLDGRVIGVNTMIFSPSGGSIGIAFAIPADAVKTVVAQLRDKGSVTRGWLGVQAQPVTADIADSLGLKEARGALVAEPQADSPAANAGIAPGDVIASIGDAPIKDARDLSKTIGNTAPGTSIKLGMLRRGEEKTVTVTLGQLPVKRQSSVPNRVPGASYGERETTGRGASGGAVDAPLDVAIDLGLKLAPADNIPGTGGQGVVVTGVDPTGLAADQGVELGDVILEISGKSVKTPDDIQSTFSDARRNGKRSILVRLKSGESTRFVAVPTG
jgi:serine protease Do